ncbi:redox-regulated ATPase YchF [soil metagenome]
MKTVGITGPSGAGKTALWKAISGLKAVGDVATVAVPDPRLDKLSELHVSKKTVYAQVEVVDVHANARTAAAANAKLRNMDALLIVVPGFGGQDGAKALAAMKDELLLADMGPIENRLAKAKRDPAAKAELPILNLALEHLNNGEFLSTKDWEKEELAVFSALAPVTFKPMIVVYNVDEDALDATIQAPGFTVITVPALLEAEVAGLGPEESKELLGAYGVSEPVMGRVIQQVYRSLDLITFFTTGEDESRAWELKRGATAPEAAGAIHTDIQRGFIRAEVVSYEELVAAGSWDKAKAAAKIRVEGKDYLFKEGDCTNFRFNV